VLLTDTSLSFNWSTLFEVYGPLGVIAAFGLWFILLTVNRLVAEKAVLTKERDDERAYSKELERNLREQIIPLLSANQATTAEAVSILDQVRSLLMAWITNRPPDPGPSAHKRRT
jgi:hypothetical protein